MKNQILRININNNIYEKISNENTHFEHGTYLRVTTLKNEILRVNI